MRIGIDISQIVYGTGVSDYTISLVKSLLKISAKGGPASGWDKKNEYVLFGGSLRQQGKLKQFIRNSTAKGVILPIPPTLADFLWNKLHFLPIETFTGKLDVFHSSDWTQPPTRAAKVTTIHDLAVLKYPEVFPPNILSAHRRRLAWVKKECDLIIAVSKSTKKDIIEILKIPEAKIHVIYEAPSFNFTSEVSPRRGRGPSTSEVFRVKKRYGIKGDYILSVATLEPRKNLQRIIKAFKILGKDFNDFQLVLVGKIGWGESLKPSQNIILTGYVTDEELSVLYSGASCLIYPSLYEGFGQPILEAMACGCPVVTSNISSMPEVAGDAAVLVDPLSVESIAEGIKKALENREELVKKGYQQVKKFSWDKCARETLKVYEEVVGRYDSAK